MKRIKLAALFIGASMSLMLAACGVDINAMIAKGELKRVEKSDFGFSVAIPPSWRDASTSQVAQFLSESKDGGVISLGVATTPASSSSKINDVLTEMKSHAKDQAKNELKSEGTLKIDNKEAAFVSFTYEESGKKMQNLEYGILDGKSSLYGAVFIAPKDQFEANKATLEAVAQSIKIIAKPCKPGSLIGGDIRSGQLFTGCE